MTLVLSYGASAWLISMPSLLGAVGGSVVGWLLKTHFLSRAFAALPSLLRQGARSCAVGLVMPCVPGGGHRPDFSSLAPDMFACFMQGFRHVYSKQVHLMYKCG